MVKEPKSLGFKTKVKSGEPLNLRRKADAGSSIIRELRRARNSTSAPSPMARARSASARTRRRRSGN